MRRTKLQHARLEHIKSRDGEFLINDIPIRLLTERVGGTPFYAYDRAELNARAARLRDALPDEIRLHYALKANPMPALAGHLAPRVDGFDVASQAELQVALNAGMNPADISFAGPGKTTAELRSAIAAGICINVESERELERVHEQSSTVGIAPRIAFRVNPDFELKGSGMKMSGSPRQFGIDSARVQAAFVRARELGIETEGVHIFCGSQNLNCGAIIEANRNTLELAARLSGLTSDGFRAINIGGGYGIPYFPGEKALDLNSVGAALGDSIELVRPQLGDADIIVELGRYIVGEAGYYVAEITDIKESQGHTFLIVNGGLHHHLANSGNFGQVIRKNYPVIVGTKLDETLPLEQVSVVGPLCTPLDIVADAVELPRCEIGDLVVVLQSGAYGLTASPIAFLSHPPPKEVLV
jgi:diaminopimelate decarboxylase